MNFQNIGKTIKKIQIRFDNNLEYIVTNFDEKITYTYANSGVKHLRFKVHYTDGTSMESQTNIFVKVPTPVTKSSSSDFEIKIPKNHKHSGGILQIKLNSNNHSGKIKKALIVAEGFDPSQVMGKENVDIQSFLLRNYYISFGTINSPKVSPNLYTELKNQDYDIVYLDYNDGIDDIRRNAALLQEAIVWVNNNKQGVHPNVVMGVSMGGVVARYALRKMEIANTDHQTWKYISVDAPHKGANVPVGFQAGIQHIAAQRLKVFFMKVLKSTWLSKDLDNGLRLLNSKAAKQMLIYRVSGGGYDNSEHNSFMKEYDELGFPEKCQNVAVSNGNNKGKTIFEAGAILAHYNETMSLKFWQKLVNLAVGGSLSSIFAITNHPELLLNILPGRTQLRISLFAASVKGNSSNKVYEGKIQLKKKIFWLIKTSVTIARHSHYAENTMIALDNAPGGMYDIGRMLNLPENMLSNIRQRQFCFVPTSSALALADWQNKITTNLGEQDLFLSRETDFEYTFSPAISELHITFSKNTNFLRENIKIPPIYIRKMDKIFCGSQIIKIWNPNSRVLHWSTTNNNFNLSNSNKLQIKLNTPPFFDETIIKASAGELYPLRKRVASNCNLFISGPASICDQEATYTVEGLPSGAAVHWNVSNSNLILISGQGVKEATFRKNGNGKCNIIAKVEYKGVLKKLSMSDIWVDPTIGSYSISLNTIGGTEQYYTNQSYYLYSIPNDDIELPPSFFPEENALTSFRWTIKKKNNSCGYYEDEDYCYTIPIDDFVYHNYVLECGEVNFQTPGRYKIELEISLNLCGGNVRSFPLFINVSEKGEDWGDMSYFISPNGDGINETWEITTTEKLEVETEESRSIENFVPVYNVTVFNKKGSIVYQKSNYMQDIERFHGVGNAGGYKDRALPDGVYFYSISGSMADSGHLYLKRE